MFNVSALKAFEDNHYARNLIFRSNSVELLLVCWRPGQGSPIHDHGTSDGLMIILEGEMLNTSYDPEGHKVSVVWRPGDIGHTPIGTRHEVTNTSTQDVVSLHIYAPPLDRSLQGADMGYHNPMLPQEVVLSNEVIRYFLGGLGQSQPLQSWDPGL